MSPGEAEVGYRRNGKRQACEPCRKGKLACDHGAPHCGRCARRKTTAKCIYHPNPMTKVRNPTSSPNLPKTSRSASAHAAGAQTTPQTHEVPAPPLSLAPESSPYASPTVNGSGMHDFHAPSSAVEESRDERLGHNLDQPGEPARKKLAGWKTAVYPKSAKYYGPTSFSAVFLENKSPDNEDILDIGEEPRRHPGSWVSGPPLLGRERPSAPGMRTKEIIKALWNIPSKDICESLLNMSTAIHDTTVNPIMIRHCLSTLWGTFGHQLTTPLTSENLTIISEVLFKNEETPLLPAPEGGLDWLNTFMGPSLRFEMLGVLFCYLGRAYLTLQDWDPLFKVPENSGRNRKETVWRMVECADTCRKMCHLSETVNEIVAALNYNISILESCCTGDETYLLRHRHGEMITSTVNAGLHRLPDYTNTRVTTASEYKRRLFSAVYFLDKTSSSLNGTPPMLGRLYCDVRPPLDLSDEELFLPPHALAVAISRLDFNGWNTEGNMYDISISRAIWQLAAVREEVLELALGVNVLITDERIDDLRQRSQHVFNSFPEQLLYYSNGKIPKDCTGKTLFSQGYLMLEFLQNMFLIERVAMARGFSTVENLLRTAMDMLDLSLMFWIMRDQLVPFTSYFDWIITFFGIPSAGVICVDLLDKQSTAQNHPVCYRSDAIQKLTLFIGFLEWIRPTDGNYKLAGRLRKVIRRVLDHVLEPQAPQSETSMSMDTPFDPALLDPQDNVDDMHWLSSIDWTRGSWIGL